MNFLHLEKKTVIKVCGSILIIALFIAILTSARIGFFSRFQTDDYCNLGSVQVQGYFQSIANRYSSWDGRYSFAVVIYFLAMLGPKVPAILPFLLIVLNLVSAVFFFKTLGNRLFIRFPMWLTLLLSAVFCFFLLYTIPGVGQDIYWMTGNTTYYLPISLELILVGLTMKITSKIDGQGIAGKILLAWVLFAFSFFVGGFSEVVATLHVSILVVIVIGYLVLILKKRLPSNNIFYWIVTLFGSMAGFVVVLVAPGNSIREGVSPAHPALWSLILNSVVMSGRFSGKWLFHYSEIIWPSFLALFFSGMVCKPELSSQFNLQKKLIPLVFTGLVISFFLILMTFLPAYWALSSYPEDRVLILPAAVLSMLVTALAFVLGLASGNSIKVESSNIQIVGWIAIFLCLFYAVSSPIYQARKFYFANFETWKTFSQRWEEQNNSILEQIREGERFIVTNKIKVDTIGLEEFTASSDYWVNICAAQYYGVEEIVVGP